MTKSVIPTEHLVKRQEPSHGPDQWRATGAAGAVVLFDMLAGVHPVRNVWGVSDPDVHKLDGRWVMFLGGLTNRFRVLLFAATLPEGAPLASTAWSLVTGPGGRTEERIYYAGHPSRSVTGKHSRYAIGCLVRTPTGWQRHGPPVHTGTPERPSVLEPLVRYDDGVWRNWYLSTPHEVGRGELPDYRLEYVEGDDGIRWSAPQVLFSTEDGYFDNAVQPVDGHYEMVVARGTNLYGTPGFPAQGLWWLRSPRLSGRRADWTGTPVRLLDTDVDPLPWFANGGCGPSFHYGDTEADRDTMYVFFTGTYARTSWLKVAAGRLARRRRPPVPAPFYLATGRIAIPRTGMDAAPNTTPRRQIDGPRDRDDDDGRGR